jgi:glycosidase
MDGVTDFSMKDAIIAAVKEDLGWNSGVAKIYNGLAWDYMYKDPMANVIFIDNHDLDRFLGVIGGNLQYYKMALGILFTMRGIPQLYYGAEINMDRGGHHGHLRQDFPGGWPDDKTDKFSAGGRSEDENSTWNYISKLANWRLTNDAVRYGKLMQFIPEDNIYVYFRYNDKQTVMVIVNAGKEEKELKTQRFEERTKGFTKTKDVITDKIQPLGTIKLQPRSTTVLELVP